MMMQLQQQMMATQKLLQAQESENSKLQQEMERLARQKGFGGLTVDRVVSLWSDH